MFEEIKNRDAWATIRGFVYQVDMTIIEWLRLKFNQIIELEKGEDIDIVNFDNDDIEKNREAIQVKRRDVSFSLNDEAVLTSIFNFIVSKMNNPSYDLKFRFLTNNPYKIEHPIIIPNGQLAIETWQAIQEKRIDNESYLEKLNQHLLSRFNQHIKKETSLEKKHELSLVIEFLKKPESFKSLVGSFTFSSQDGEKETTIDAIIELILNKNLASDLTDAKRVYHLLFFTVFKTLSKKGLKRLSLELLGKVIDEEINPNDQKLFSETQQFIKEYEDRLVALESNIEKNTTAIHRNNDAINNLINSSIPEQKNTFFSYKLNSISQAVPMTIKNGSARKLKVKGLLSSFKDNSWIHFCGLSGNGKTQLAALLCSEVKTSFWLDLREFFNEKDNVHLIIETFLSTISGKSIKSDRSKWLNSVIETIPENSIVVFNDLPILEPNTSTGNLLIHLLNEIENSSIKLLTTSNHVISKNYLQFVSEKVILNYNDFKFSDEEIREYLTNMGSPDNVLNFINIIANVTHRNPRLLTTLILNLKAINWGQNSTELLGEIVKEDFATEVLEDNQRSIKKYISSESSRTLLYRLSLINWGLKKSTIEVISNVEEKIKNHGECLSDLINIWVEQQYKDTYQVSPLIYNIGKNNLSTDEVKRVHLEVAKSIAAKGLINQIDASRIIDSFIEAEEYDKAGASLMNIYIAAKDQSEIKALEEWGLLNYWLGEDIPNQMNIVLRSYIRFQQISLFDSLNIPATWLDNTIYNLLFKNKESLSTFEKTSISLLVISSHNERTELKKFWDAIDVLLESWTKLKPKEKKPFSTEIIFDLSWRVIPYLKSKVDILDFLDFFGKIHDTLGGSIFTVTIADTSIQILSSKTRLNEFELGDGEFENMKLLQDLSEYFSKRSSESLEAIIYRDLANLEIDNGFKTPSEVIKEFRSHINKFTNGGAKVVLLNSGSVLLSNEKKDEESELWLREAVNTNATNQYYYIDSLVRLGTKEKPKKAIEYFEKAISLGNSLKFLNPIKCAKIYSEIAISNWMLGMYEETFLNFEKAVIILFQEKENNQSDDWIRTLSLSGHSMGYIAADISSNRKIEFTNDGSNYTVPFSGIVYLNEKDLTDFYKERYSPTIMAQLAMIADGAKKLDKSYEWSMKAFDYARATKNNWSFWMIASSTAPKYALVNFKIKESIEAYLTSMALLNNLEGDHSERLEQYKSIDEKWLLDQRPNEAWNEAENATIRFGVIPIIIMIMNQLLNNDEMFEEKNIDLTQFINDYREKASDKLLWELVLEIYEQILNNEITEAKLSQRASTFGERGKLNLQLLCVLGIAYLSNDHLTIIQQLINILPSISQLHNSSHIVIEHCLVPFVRTKLQIALEKGFVGSKEDYDKLISQLKGVSASNKNVLQKMLFPLVEEFEVTISADRRDWLNKH